MRFRGIITDLDFDYERTTHYLKIAIESGNVEEANKYIIMETGMQGFPTINREIIKSK